MTIVLHTSEAIVSIYLVRLDTCIEFAFCVCAARLPVRLPFARETTLLSVQFERLDGMCPCQMEHTYHSLSVRLVATTHTEPRGG